VRSPRGIALFLAVAFVAIALAISIFAPRATRLTTTGSVTDVTGVTHGTPLMPQRTARDFVLPDGDGRPTHLLARAYPLTLLFFGYTHCPDACPLALGSLGRAYRMLDATERARTRIVFVSVDPVRDRPSVVRSYVRGFDPHIVGLTGSARELSAVWKAYRIQVNAKTHEIEHGDTIYAIDVSDRMTYIYPPDSLANDLATDMRALAR